MRWGFPLILILILHASAVGQDVSFRREVAPLLESKCLRCHSGDHPKGDLDLSSPKGLAVGGATGTVIKPGSAAESLLYNMVNDKKMPPKEKLTTMEISLLRHWIDAGANWEGDSLRNDKSTLRNGGNAWWSFQPIRRPSQSTVRQAIWVRNPIDQFILSQLESAGLHPAPEADRRTYIRRVSFDLLGLPPTPEEIDAFVNDTAADAHERLVDRLLASPHYGERWGRHWLDVVRFGESHGYETNELRRNAWPYRDWLIQALNEDKPFRKFVAEQLAGDVLSHGDPNLDVATGFLVAGTHDIVGNETAEGKAQQRQDDLYDMVSTTGSAFLGLTVNCARCHDHKFDPITQIDYYALQAVFAGVHHGARQLNYPEKAQLASIRTEQEQLRARLQTLQVESSTAGPPNAALNTEVFPAIDARFVRFTILATARNDEPCIDELEIWSAGATPKNVALQGKPSASSVFPDNTLHRIEHLNDGKFGNSRSWISNEKGRGWAQLELPSPIKIDRIMWGRDRERKFDDRLATQYRIEVSLDGSSWKSVCTEFDRKNRTVDPAHGTRLHDIDEGTRKLKEMDARMNRVRDRITVYCGTFKSPDTTYLLKRGDPMQKLQKVDPAPPRFLGIPLRLRPDASEGERRLALAEWITDQNNPLPARVMVNRLWHYHYGRGIVDTPSDFGANGGRPSHPGLLDWLASEFLAQGGRQKPIHRLIVLSATYRQASVADALESKRATTLDTDNRLLWHAPRRRLEAEALRDATLFVSGNLDLRRGGPGYDLWETSNYVVVFKPKVSLAPDAYRRMVYQFKPRTQQDPTFGAFDCPDATQTTPRRNVSTTALQALNLLHSRFMLDQCERFARRLRTEGGEEPAGQVRRGFLLAFGRPPSAKELQTAVDVVGRHGLEAFCRALLNANEFLFVD